MPADTTTPNYGWVQPAVGADATVWGTKLNQTIAAIDSQVFSNEQGVLPIGSGALWFTNTPPANWLLCQGQTLAQASYQALYNAIGGLYNIGTVASGYFMLPNLEQVFPLGSGATNVLASIGGFLSQTLTAANLPSHTHTITQVAHGHTATQPAHIHPDPGHSHGVNDNQHAHGSNLVKQGAGTAGLTPGGVFPIAGSGNTDPAPTGIGIQAAATNLQAAGGDAVTVNATTPSGPTVTGPVGSGTPITTVPPFLAINFIIRYQ